MDITNPVTNRQTERIRCLEVWGGNARVEKQVQIPGLDVCVSSQPLGDDDAGGDVYYISSCASGRLTRILLADVSGHGQEVAHIAEQLRDLMRKYIEVADHRRLVADMNHEFEGGAANGIFASSVVISFFAPTRSLLLCNAGHPSPLVYRSSTGRWEYLERLAAEVRSPRAEPADLPLGMLPHTDYEQRKVRLEPGDTVVCYTDAFSEARRADGSPLGTAGLLESVSAIPTFSDGTELATRIVGSLRTLHPENLNQDDSTLVVFRATGQRFRLRDQLTAPFRVAFKRPSEVCSIGEPRRHRQAESPPKGSAATRTGG